MLLADDPAIHTRADHAYKTAFGGYQIIQLPDVHCFFHNYLSSLRQLRHVSCFLTAKIIFIKLIRLKSYVKLPYFGVNTSKIKMHAPLKSPVRNVRTIPIGQSPRIMNAEKP